MSNTDNTNKSDTTEQKNDTQDLGRPVGQQSVGDSSTPHTAQSAQNTTEEQLTPPVPPALARPWYASPWFWSIFLILGILTLVAWLFWLQWQAYVLQRSKDEAFILAQENRNKELEAHMAHLQKYLAYDPCVLKEMLGKEGILLSLPVAKGGQPVAPIIPSGTPLQIPSHLVPPPTTPTPIAPTTPSGVAPSSSTPVVVVPPHNSGQQGSAMDAPSPPPVSSGSSLAPNTQQDTQQPKKSENALAPASPPPPPASSSGMGNSPTSSGPSRQSPLFPPTEAEAPPPPPLPNSHAPASPPPATPSGQNSGQGFGITSGILNAFNKE